MKFKSTFALTLVLGLCAVGGSAQEAPNSDFAEPSLVKANSGPFAGRAVVRSAGYGTDRGQIFLFADSDLKQGGEERQRGSLFKRLSGFFKRNASHSTEPVSRAKRTVKRTSEGKDPRIALNRLGYFFAPGLDEARSAAFDNPRVARKSDRRLKKSDERRARLVAKEKKRKKTARRLSQSEERRLAARMDHDRGSGSWIGRAFVSLKVNKPVTSDRKYGMIVARYARAYGVPVDLAHAVIKVESNYRVNARGRAGEVGLMQIKPATARMMGYSGTTKGLYTPETNIKYGMKYLGKAHKLGGGSTCGTILKYNAGHAARRMNPISARYCAKVKRHLRGA